MNAKQLSEESKIYGEKILNLFPDGTHDGVMMISIAAALACLIATSKNPEAEKTIAVEIIDDAISGKLFEDEKPS